MYIDCKICGFESECFCPLGAGYDKQMIEAAESNKCLAIKNPNGSFSFKCPKGHDADLLPTEVKFRSRHRFSTNKLGLY